MIARILVKAMLLLAAGAAQPQEALDPSTLEFFPYPISAEVAIVHIDAAALADPADGAASDGGAAGRADAPSAELREAVRTQIEAIERQVMVGGPRSAALADELVKLATLYEQAGHHVRAIGMLEEALGIVRMTSGLYSFAQVRIIEGLIGNWLAIEQYARVAELDEHLLELVFRNPQEPGVAPVLVAAADRHMDSFEQLFEAGVPPTISVRGGVVAGPPEPVLRIRQHPALTALRSARFLYEQAQLAAIGQGSHSPVELFELEERIIQTYYIEASEPDLHGRPPLLHWELSVFRSGEAALHAHVANSTAFRMSPTAVSQALIRLGDWRLLFSRNGQAIDTYRQAQELLVAADADAQTIDELLAPAVPVAIPVHSYLQPLGTPPYHGYVDVSFVIGKYGTPRNVRILDMSDATSPDAVRRLRHELYGSRFRPPLVSGQIGQAVEVSARYYYKYRPPTQLLLSGAQ